MGKDKEKDKKDKEKKEKDKDKEKEKEKKEKKEKEKEKEKEKKDKDKKEKEKVPVDQEWKLPVSKNLDSIIQGFSDSRIYKFLHLPVQSGDNKILNKMNRKYTIDDFYFVVKKFRDTYPKITISTDIIVGFPTETNDQFNRSIKLIKEVYPDIVNITRYSARPYTKAKSMNGRVKTDIVKERSKILTNICRRILKEKNSKHIGKKYNVLIIKKGKNNTSIGKTDNYKSVVLSEDIEIGLNIDVEIISATSTHLVGTLI